MDNTATHTIEILAPAGGQEQLLAAVRCGADAVYLGAKGFNARRNAENFDDASLAQAVAYCHARQTRVYVTVNTLVTDAELPALLDTLQEVADSGADALIVQDLAVAALAREHCPGLALHASTQMALHNAAGVQAAQALGISRVVLARELSIPEIGAIAEQTGVELEVFVHGALCMSVSGACYLSSMLGGRSGNRGLCAQPCRLDFRAGERPYALSLKDLSALAHVRALGEAGVCALKIEGRMKRPEYVAAAVTACRKALAGEPYDLQALEDVFSRGGFTDGYLSGRRTLSMFGRRTKEDAEASRRAQRALTGLYQRERASVPVDMVLKLRLDAPAALTACDGHNTACASGEVAQIAIAAPTDGTRARRSLCKTGETPFFLRSLRVENEHGLMLPSAALNVLRRDALGRLLALRETPSPGRFVPGPLPVLAAHQARQAPRLRARLASAAQWPGAQDADEITLPLVQIMPEHVAEAGDRLIGELPALIFPGDEEAVRARLRDLRAVGLRHALCENLGAVRLAEACGLTPRGGHGLNILNSLAARAYAGLGLADITVSFELHAAKLRALGGDIPRGALAYGYLPLMRLRCCPAQGAAGCGRCDGRSVLVDRTGARFALDCQERKFSTLYNSIALNLSGEALSGADFLTLYFTSETAAECRRVVEDFRAGRAPQGARTRGLYYRTLQ